MTLSALGIFSAAGAGGAPYIGAGYFAGGSTTAVILSKVDKFTFPADTKTTLATGLSATRILMAGMANSKVAGYVGGGQVTGGTKVSTVDKFAFPADTRSTLGTGLSTDVQALAAFANSGTAGYFAAGLDQVDNRLTTVNKFAFPSDTRTTLGTGTSSARWALAGMADSGVAGYVGSGTTGIGGAFNSGITNTVDKFALPSDTRTTTTITTGRVALSAMANSGVAGYFSGGVNSSGTPLSSVNKLTFPSDTASTLATGLSFAPEWNSGMADSGVAGYFSQVNSGVAVLDSIDKFAFPSDTRSVLTAKLSEAKYQMAAFADNAGL